MKNLTPKQSMHLNPTDDMEVISTVKKVKDKNSIGHDDISSKLLKEIIHSITIPPWQILLIGQLQWVNFQML